MFAILLLIIIVIISKINTDRISFGGIVGNSNAMIPYLARAVAVVISPL